MHIPHSPHECKSETQSREAWLHAVLHSGRVTRVGQHLALVIFHLTSGQSEAKLSSRDLERITGWGRTAIVDHLSELQIFIRVEWGRGRSKSTFALADRIDEVINSEVCVRQPDTKRRSSVRQPDTTPFVRDTDTTADTTADTKVSVRQPDTRTAFNPPYKESISTIPKITTTQPGTAREEGGGLGILNGAAEPMLEDIIRWMVGGNEIAARSWLANNIKQYGAVAVKNSYADLKTHILEGQTIARPLIYWTRIAQRHHAKGAEAKKSTRPSRW